MSRVGVHTVLSAHESTLSSFGKFPSASLVPVSLNNVGSDLPTLSNLLVS